MARVLIIHGWTNRRPEGHWQRFLAGELRDQGHIVAYPQLPDADDPKLDAWLEVVLAELKMLGEVGERSNEELVVIAHSLGCITWIQAADKGLISELPARLLLVAPPEPQPEAFPGFASFVMPYDLERIKNSVHSGAKHVTLVGSDSDVWQPSGIQAGVGDIVGLQAVVVEGAKHFSHSDDFHRWQGVIDWVNDPSADLTKV